MEGRRFFPCETELTSRTSLVSDGWMAPHDERAPPAEGPPEGSSLDLELAECEDQGKSPARVLSSLSLDNVC